MHVLARGIRYLVTEAYIVGANHAAECKLPRNPFPPGTKYAQYGYGYNNERGGFHDDLPDLVADDRG